MTRSLRAGVIAVAAIAIGIGLSGCGSETKAEPSPSQQTSTESSATSSKAAPTTSAQASGPNKTVMLQPTDGVVSIARTGGAAQGASTLYWIVLNPARSRSRSFLVAHSSQVIVVGRTVWRTFAPLT